MCIDQQKHDIVHVTRTLQFDHVARVTGLEQQHQLPAPAATATTSLFMAAALAATLVMIVGLAHNQVLKRMGQKPEGAAP